MNNYIYSDELYHYGVLGMKWGIRRYQNFDGTYTKAGLRRLKESQNIYEKRKKEYKTIKNDKTKSKYEIRYAKAKMKEANRRVRKDYKHLALDKKGDEGKILYAQGKRITNTKHTTYMIGKAGALLSTGATYAHRYGYISTKTRNYAYAVSIGATAVSGIKSLLDEIPNNKLRAYYSHTSKY